jgi:hypothetical protein
MSGATLVIPPTCLHGVDSDKIIFLYQNGLECWLRRIILASYLDCRQIRSHCFNIFIQEFQEIACTVSDRNCLPGGNIRAATQTSDLLLFVNKLLWWRNVFLSSRVFVQFATINIFFAEEAVWISSKLNAVVREVRHILQEYGRLQLQCVCSSERMYTRT